MASHNDPERARQSAQAVVQGLRQRGFEAYFAGGCVRDELLGFHPTDYDVATSATPADVRDTFRGTRLVGESFGVVLVPAPRADRARTPEPPMMVEVATFRTDGPYTDKRRPDAVRFADATADAQRRDFTINALFLDPLATPDDALRCADGSVPRGRVIDHVGGVADLRAQIIRAVGDPDARFNEDHLRALRAVRFAARLGFAIDAATSDAVRRHASSLAGVSRERVGQELRRMLTHPARARAVRLLEAHALDAPVLNESSPADSSAGRALVNLPAHAVGVPLALAAWALDRHAHGPEPALDDPAIQSIVEHWRAGMCLTNDERDALRSILEIHRALVLRWGEPRSPGVQHPSGAAVSMTVAERKRTAARRDFAAAAALLRAVDQEKANAIASDVDMLSTDGVGIRPEPFLSGEQLISDGWPPGPAFKHALHMVYDAQLEGRVRDAASALALARELARELAKPPRV